MFLNNYFLKYFWFFKKKKTINQKIRFLSCLKKDFEKFNYFGEILQTIYKKKKSIMLYCGDFKKAKNIIITHYDNPLWFFFNKNFEPFNEKKIKLDFYRIPFLLILFILLIKLIFFFYIAKPIFLIYKVYSVYSFVLWLIIIFFTFMMIYVSKVGIESTNFTTVNNSSFLTMLKIAELLKKNKNYKNKKVCFFFVDDGYKDRFGYLVFKKFYNFNNLNKKSLFFLDMVGANSIFLNHLSFKAPILYNISKYKKFFGGGKKKNKKIIQNGYSKITNSSLNKSAKFIINNI